MDTPRILLVVAAIVQFALWLVLAGRYRTPVPPPGAVVLRYGWKLRFLGLCIAFAIPILLILLFVASPLPQTPRLLPIGVTLLLLGFVGGALLLETQAVHLIVSDASIVGVSPWRKRLEWRWDQVVKVDYSLVNRWLILHGPEERVIRASLYLVGIGDLARALVRHVSGMKISAARSVIDRMSAK